MTYLTRRVDFSASHRYRLDDLSEEENLRLFGKCSYPHGHGHNYRLEVTVKGKADDKTGMVINLTDLDRLLKEKIVEVLDHRFLNLDVPEFEKKVPTTENLALYIWDALDGVLEGSLLHKVRLYEDPTLFAEYCGEE